MLLRSVATSARDLGLPGRRVLVAVSGGLDSTVLLHLLAALREPLGIELAVGHVDHGLRGADARADAEFVRALGARLGIEAHEARVDPGALRANGSSRARPTLEEAARRLRYRALDAMADACRAAHVATAHHANDQAETVLLRLLRGSGPDGLGGIPERSPDGRVVRPLLRVTRAEIASFAHERGIAWREDGSNQSPRFARNRLRRWLPVLEQEHNPRLLRAIVDLAEAQRRDSEWIETLVEREAGRFLYPGAAESGVRLARAGWGGLPPPLARRLARRALRHCGVGREVSRVHLERMLGFLTAPRTGARLELPGGLVLHCKREAFCLGAADGRAGAPRARPPAVRKSRASGRVRPEGAC